MYKYLLLSTFACLAWTRLASAQFGLGAPAIPEAYSDAGYGTYAPAIYPAGSSTHTRPRISHPILGFFERTIFLPIRAVAGHLMPPRYEVIPTKEDVGRMILDGGYSPAEISAVKIRIDEAKAQARRAAVKYLATIDCNYYPEAETGLIAALRADRIEMVRYEAAVGLGNCRVLTDKMLEALNLAALGGDLDGNPAESSERVRMAARNALHRCVCRGLCLPPAEPPQMLPPAAWLPPESPSGVIEPTFYGAPMYVPVSQDDRRQAEMVSVTYRADSLPRPQRSFFHALLNINAGRGSRGGVDPRLQGLAPLGAEYHLAIPTTSAPGGE